MKIKAPTSPVMRTKIMIILIPCTQSLPTFENANLQSLEKKHRTLSMIHGFGDVHKIN